MSGRIATFYSFKGGVGRSMALANVAILLARRGLKVLAVDWDLEAPGLERYFDALKLRVARGGLVPFLVEQNAYLEAGKVASPDSFAQQLWSIETGTEHPIALLPSGRASHGDYLQMLDQFSWSAFFAHGGGDLLEKLRQIWREQFDLVLIDSRTGMSDSGGICTIQMPDLLVAMFTANFQSVLGTRDVIRSVRTGRQRLAYDRSALTILPLLSRIPVNSRPELAAEWIARIASELGEYTSDWLPKGVNAAVAFEKFKLPHDDAYAFGERLAVTDTLGSTANVLYAAYDNLATLLASDLTEAAGLLGVGEAQPAYSLPSLGTRLDQVPTVADQDESEPPAEASPDSDRYDHDVFVSAPHTGGAMEEWILGFVRAVAQEVSRLAGRDVSFWQDATDLSTGSDFLQSIEEALRRSRVMLAVLTPQYATSSYCLREWQLFEQRENRSAGTLIVPVALTTLDTFPERFLKRTVIDLQLDDFSSLNRPEAQAGIDHTARALVALLNTGSSESHEARLDSSAESRHRLVAQSSILIATSNLASLGTLELEVEAQEIAGAANPPGRPPRFLIHSVSNTRLESLVSALQTSEPSILHFSGHSSGSSIVLGDSEGRARLISPEEIAKVIAEALTPIRLVVLNVGDSTDLAMAIANHVEAVVAFEGALRDRDARSFATGFYSALGAGKSVKDAIEQGGMMVKTEAAIHPTLVSGSGAGGDITFPEPRAAPEASVGAT